MSETNISALGYTFKTAKAKVEVTCEVIYGTPTVFLQRNHRHGQGDLMDAIRDGFIKETGENKRKMSFKAEEMEFLHKIAPLFGNMEHLKLDDLLKLAEAD